MRAYVKDIFREVKHSLGRFLSILMIAAIGTAFFAGVKASVPDMKKSADHYFDQQNLMDIKIMSSIGFSKDDVKAIKKIKGIEAIDATFSMDFLAEKGTSQKVVKTIAWQDLDKNNKNYINQPRLESGRMPNKESECLIESEKMIKNGYKIGNQITLKSGNENAIEDVLKQTTFTIVGTCIIPDYLSHQKGTSNIGSGKVDSFIIIPKSNYISDYYTEVLIRVKDVKALNTYSDDYFKQIKPITSDLEKVKKKRKDIRYQEMQTIAQANWNKGNSLFEENKTNFNNEISIATKELESAKNTLDKGEIQFANAKKEFNDTLTYAQTQIAQAQTQLTTLHQQIESLKITQHNLHSQYDTIIAQANTTIEKLTEEIIALQTQYDNEIDEAIKAKLYEQIQSKSSLKVIMENIAQVDYSVVELQSQFSSASQILEDKKTALTSNKKYVLSQFKQQENELRNGWIKYNQGAKELKENQTLGQLELQRVKEDLEIAQKEIQNLKQPSWYVLDRNSHYAYRDYGSVADRMDGIAKVFPVFFLLVAALVCLTTMTRFVDEQRSIIGTYKALGYSKAKIAIKYLIYAFVASILGSILGCIVGMYLFPTVIFNGWNILYNLPALIFEPQIPLALVSSFCVIGISVLATAFACYKDLMEDPASLMRPKAPKNGKTILLERVKFLWSHFSFTQKVTARNIFRYKKRFFMTIIGISGCTALLLAGFGIRDSIAQIVEIQYEEITQYDATINLDENTSLKQRNALIKEISTYKLSERSMALTTLRANVKVAQDEQSVTIMIPDDQNEIEDFINLRTRTNHQALSLNNKGVIISEKLSKNLGASVGDKIEITLDNNKKYKVKVESICENYVGHLIYMSPEYYQQLTSKSLNENTILLEFKEASEKSETQLGKDFVNHQSVSSISYYRGVAKSFEDTISSISFVTYVLIGAAGLLAFVVLYNLTNVNISERLREIATIKVLGFYDLEVASYVYRENILLTLIGSGVGCLLGFGLHQLIMELAEMPDVMFGRNINLLSYGYAISITLLFSMAVNLVMYRKLRNIPMVESLKSVE